jgi:hypothetical protein
MTTKNKRRSPKRPDGLSRKLWQSISIDQRRAIVSAIGENPLYWLTGSYLFEPDKAIANHDVVDIRILIDNAGVADRQLPRFERNGWTKSGDLHGELACLAGNDWWLATAYTLHDVQAILVWHSHVADAMLNVESWIIGNSVPATSAQRKKLFKSTLRAPRSSQG